MFSEWKVLKFIEIYCNNFFAGIEILHWLILKDIAIINFEEEYTQDKRKNQAVLKTIFYERCVLF